MSLQIESKANEFIYLTEKALLIIGQCAGEYGEVELNKFTPQQIAQLVHELSALAWISVEDELPKKVGWYQTKNSTGYTFPDYFDGGGFQDVRVKHWQPSAKGRKDND